MAKKFTYTEATEEIEQIIAEIESGKLELDELSTKVKKASLLIKKCKEHLHKTEKDINDILNDFEE